MSNRTFKVIFKFIELRYSATFVKWTVALPEQLGNPKQGTVLAWGQVPFDEPYIGVALGVVVLKKKISLSSFK